MTSLNIQSIAPIDILPGMKVRHYYWSDRAYLQVLTVSEIDKEFIRLYGRIFDSPRSFYSSNLFQQFDTPLNSLHWYKVLEDEMAT